MKKFKLDGTPSDTKKLNTVLNQLLRKTNKVTTFATPPIPVTFYKKEFNNNDSFNYLISIDSNVKTLVLFFDLIKDVKEILFDITITNKEGVNTYFIPVVPGITNKLKKEISLFVGDRISITSQYENIINNLWIGFPLNIDAKNFNYKQLVIDNLALNDIEIEEISE